ncbi:MAG: Maf family protein [Polyangiales bacterium]
MSDSELPLVLGSASPRRADILATLGIPFEVRVSDVDERSLMAPSDSAFVRLAARTKLERVLEDTTRGRFVLAADTIVCVDGQRLEKPSDDDEALRMLSRLVGRDHRVKTAIALGQGGDGVLGCECVETRVWFDEVGREQLARYVAIGEGRDKAGAYGIQGMASGFVTRLEGSYTNVVGLPAAEVVALLRGHGALRQWP